jgi:hypothetical protein
VFLIQGQCFEYVFFLALGHVVEILHDLFGLVETGDLLFLLLEGEGHGVDADAESVVVGVQTALDLLALDLEQLLLFLTLFVV